MTMLLIVNAFAQSLLWKIFVQARALTLESACWINKHMKEVKGLKPIHRLPFALGYFISIILEIAHFMMCEAKLNSGTHTILEISFWLREKLFIWGTYHQGEEVGGRLWEALGARYPGQRCRPWPWLLAAWLGLPPHQPAVVGEAQRQGHSKDWCQSHPKLRSRDCLSHPLHLRPATLYEFRVLWSTIHSKCLRFLTTQKRSKRWPDFHRVVGFNTAIYLDSWVVDIKRIWKKPIPFI